MVSGVEQSNRLARFGDEYLEAAPPAECGRIVVANTGETTVVVSSWLGADDLVRGIVEELTSIGARLYGRRAHRNRAMRAVFAAWGPVEWGVV
jgi:putative resolvase